MKVITTILSLCLLVSLNSCKDSPTSKINTENVLKAAKRDANAGKFPKIEFEETTHDFGTINLRTPVEITFKYKNTGDVPLVITDIKPTCGCTVPESWDKGPLLPGKQSQFTVKFNGAGKNRVSKSIVVHTNTKKGKETVKITGFINPQGMMQK